jgi:hypothetical protein
MELDDIFKALLGLAYLIYLLVSQYNKYKRSRLRAPPKPTRPPEPQPQPEVEAPDSVSRGEVALSEPDLSADLYAEERAELTERLIRIEGDARTLAQSARIERATRPFAGTLEDYVAKHAQSVHEHLSDRTTFPSMDHVELIERLELVLAQLEVFVGQRRDAELRARLGDAETLALACYRPVMDFARAQGLPLSSARPVTQLDGYELAIWTGFIPTGLAPIFLPPDFFEDLFWWPALAHEIGHDFLAATDGLEEGLRAELELPDELSGRRLLPFGRQGQLTEAHLWGLLGGWFEELFCDMFGTSMLGPSYVQTMVRLFARPDDPREVVLVGRDGAHAYDLHPPRHLRVLAVVHWLERMSYHEEAAKLLAEWSELHGEIPDHLLFPHTGGYVALSAAPVIELLHALIDQLHDEQFESLGGYQLRSIPGMDYGPNLDAQSHRAAAALEQGNLPNVAQTRALIGGAVIAASRRPERAGHYLALVRRVIRAEGTFEQAPTPGSEQPLPWAGDEADERERLRQAFILYTVLAPPPAVTRGPSRRRPGLF